LLDFEKSIIEFEKRNIQVIAASVDTLENANETMEKYKISFKAGYGLNARGISSKTGAYS
jgi:peroxiredoxin